MAGTQEAVLLLSKKKDLTASYGEFPTQLLTLYSWLTLGQSLILSSHSD